MQKAFKRKIVYFRQPLGLKIIGESRNKESRKYKNKWNRREVLKSNEGRCTNVYGVSVSAVGRGKTTIVILVMTLSTKVLIWILQKGLNKAEKCL